MSANPSFEVWRDFRRIWEQLHAKRPEGFEAEVTVYFMDGESIVPSRVWRDGPYLVFAQGGDNQQDVRIASVPEGAIARIECRYVKSKHAQTSTGFQVTEQGEPPPLPEPENDDSDAVAEH